MNWLFLIIIIFLISMAYGGYKKGIMRMLFSVISFFVATLAMIIVAPYVSDALVDSEPLMEKIKKPVYDVVMEQLDEGKNIDGILEEYHLPQKLSTSIEKFVNENVQDKKNAAADGVAQCVAEYVCRILSYVIVFVVVRLALEIVGHVIKIFEHLPVINTLNNVGGLALGLVEAFGCIWLFFMIADIFHATQFGIVIRTMIWDNQLLRELYNKNPFLIFMK